MRPDATKPILPKAAQSAPDLATLLMALMAVWVLWVPVLWLNLTPALFAALISFTATRALAHRLRESDPKLQRAEGVAVAILVGFLFLIGLIIGDYLRDLVGHFPTLMQRMAGILENMRETLPEAIAKHIPPSVEAFRAYIVGWLRSNATPIQLWGGHTLRGLGYVLVGTVVGALAAVQLAKREDSKPSTAFVDKLNTEFNALKNSFTQVVFAQVRIAAINAVLTGVFLLGIMPLIDRPIPMAGTLVAITFLTGLIPVLGNLISNTIIVILALSSSPVDAGLALGWLVAIHKLEYFLNAHIVGNRIRAHAWELLIMMLLMEAVFGIAGLISAPIMYAQIKSILHRRGWIK
jgi:predicted PurR-regulated permease PerM